MSDNVKQSDSQELVDLLELAESVQASYESSVRRQSVWWLAEVVLAAAAALFVVYGLVWARSPTAWIAGAVALVAYSFTIDVALLRGIRRRSRSDRNALHEVLKLLREVEGVTSAEDNWTPLQQAEFRIRLSRFAIEEPESIVTSLRRSARASLR